MSTTIDIDTLAKHYPPLPGAKADGPTRAVDDISLTIPAGSLFFLLGPSGCGKTTLLRMIAGFIDPTHGHIRFNSKDVTHTPPNKRNTGMVFQSYALWPHMTVLQNVAFGLSVRKISKEDQQKRANEALRAVRMDQYAQRKPNQLSGGQQQRVALARALVVRPDVLLLDEPLSNLDAKLRLEMRTEIRRICKETGITTVYVTHDQKEALSMADHVAVLNNGKVAQLGTPRDIYNRPTSRFVADFLGETNFLTAEVTDAQQDRLALHCPAGDLASTAFDHDATPPSGSITCSIRPEAITLTDHHSPNHAASLPAHIKHTIYLGEMAQHIVELKDSNQTLKVFELHPAHAADDRADVHLNIAPEDVVVLND